MQETVLGVVRVSNSRVTESSLLIRHHHDETYPKLHQECVMTEPHTTRWNLTCTLILPYWAVIVLSFNTVHVSVTSPLTPIHTKRFQEYNVPIVTGASAWTSPNTSETFILVFHKALWMGNILTHSLINPNQLCHYGINVHDNPYSLTAMHIGTEEDEVSIPLLAHGTTIYFDSRMPTDKELQTCRPITLTSQAEWNPHEILYPEPLHQVQDITQDSHIQSRCSVDDTQDIIVLDPHNICERLISRIMISDIWTDSVPSDVPLRRTYVSNERHPVITASELSERWCIGLKQATDTLKITTQHGV